MKKRKNHAKTVVLLVLLLYGQGFGGKLKDFEKDVTQNETSDKDKDHADRDRDDTDYGSTDGGFFTEGFGASCGDLFGLIPLSLIAGGVNSWNRVTAPKEGDMDRRKANEPLIPFIRLDAGYQVCRGDIEAPSARVQAGFGPAAIEYELIHFKEKKTDDRLDFQRICGLYRMSFGRVLEVDLGLGALTLQGVERTSEIVYTTPILIYPTERWGVEFRPAWAHFEGSLLQDYDLGAYLNWKGGSLKAGYRWILSRHQDLSGPYIGMAFRY